jgi:hypothetical protein
MAPSKRKNASPEHMLQMAVKEYLTYALPSEAAWTASAVGVNLTMFAAQKLKSAGVRRGWPDLQFLLPDGRVVFIELKSDVGSLSTEQRDFRDRCLPHGIWALCRSVDQVAAALASWGVALKAVPAGVLLRSSMGEAA